MSGIPAWAVRGAKVVVIRDFVEARHVGDMGYRRLPPLHSVQEVTRSVWRASDPAPAIYLVGFPTDHGFDVRGFRPVTEPKSEAEDTAYFRKLITQPVRETA